MDTVKQRIEEIKANGLNLDFGTTFNHAFDIYKKIAINAGLIFMLLSFVFCIFGAMFFGMGVFNLAAFSEQMATYEMENFAPGSIVIYLIAVIACTAILTPLNAGLIKMAYNADANQPHSVSTAFEYYKAPYFSDLVVSGVVIGTVSTILNMLLEYMGYPVIGAILGYLVTVFAVLTIPLIIFGNLKALEAIQSSIMIVLKNPLMILALMIVAALFACVGIIAFCIGILFTLPIVYAMYYSIYVYTVGVVDNNISKVDGNDDY